MVSDSRKEGIAFTTFRSVVSPRVAVLSPLRAAFLGALQESGSSDPIRGAFAPRHGVRGHAPLGYVGGGNLIAWSRNMMDV